VKFNYTPLATFDNPSSAVGSINANFASLQGIIERLVSRDGTSPNTMTDDLDMNSSRIVNLPPPVNNTEPLRLKDLHDFAGESYRTTTNVVSYGADKTGVTNSLSAFNDAIAVLKTLGGGTLLVPDGTYLISDGSVEVFNASNIHIKGDSLAGSIIVNGNTDLPTIRVGDNVTFGYGNCVSDLTFAGASDVTGVDGQYGLAIYKQGHCSYNNLKFTSYPSPLYRGLTLTGCSQVFVNQIQVQNCTGFGIQLLDNADIYASTMRFDACTNDGLSMAGCQGMYFTSCWGFGNGRYAWNLYHDTGSNNNNFFVNCGGDTSGQNNWMIDDLYDSIFTACWGSTQLSKSSYKSSCGFYFTGPRVNNVQLVGGSCVYNNTHGLAFAASGGGAPTKIRVVGMTLGAAAKAPYVLAHPNGASDDLFGFGLYVGVGAEVTEVACSFGSNSSGPVFVEATGTLNRISDTISVPTSIRTTGILGYNTGAGGTVTQATNKSTGVTLSKSCGEITLNNAALAASTTVSFTLTNTLIEAGDVLILNHASGGTLGSYSLNASCGSGSASINVRNISAGSLSEAIIIRFSILKAVTA
jgi:hypothetical protein